MGRPKNSGLNDLPLLRCIAGEMTRKAIPYSRAATIVASEYRGRTSRQSLLSRLRRKWNLIGKQLLAEARTENASTRRTWSDEQALFAAHHSLPMLSIYDRARQAAGTMAHSQLERLVAAMPLSQITAVLQRQQFVADQIYPSYLGTALALAEERRRLIATGALVSPFGW